MKEQLLITGNNPVLRSHIVRGEPTLPGLAYIDLIYQCLRATGCEVAEWELRDLTLYAPMTVRDGREIQLDIESTRVADDVMMLLIEGTESGVGTAGPSTRYVTARAQRVGRIAFTERLEPAVRTWPSSSLDVSGFYGEYAALGVVHGDFMKVAGEASWTESSARASVQVTGTALDAAEEFLFHPALLDGCALALAVALSRSGKIDAKALSLPMYLESFRVSAAVQRACQARVRFDTVQSRNGLRYMTIELFDSASLKVGELRNLAGAVGLTASAADDTPRAGTNNESVPLRAESPPPHAQTPSHPNVRPAASASAEPVEAFLMAQLSVSQPLPAGFSPVTAFGDAGMDSARLVQMLQDVEVRVGTPLSPLMLFEHGSVRELAAFLAAEYGGAFADVVQHSAPPSAAVAAAEVNDTVRAQPLSPDKVEAPRPVVDPVSRIEAFILSDLRSSQNLSATMSPATSFADAGLDSGGLVAMLQRIELRVGAPLSPLLLFEHGSVRELATFLASTYADSFVDLEQVPAPVAASVREPAGPAPDRVEVRRAGGPAPAPVIVTRASEPATAPAATRAAVGPALPTRATGDEIAIVGVSGRFPRAPSVQVLWQRLAAGEDCVVEVPEERWNIRTPFDFSGSCRWGGFIEDADKFDASFFGVDAGHALCMDPQQRMFLESCWHVLENAGYTRHRIRSEHRGRVGVYVGAMYNDYRHVESTPQWETLAYANFNGSIANRVSQYFDFHGPSMAIDTLCSSTAVGLHLACTDLRSGNCELAIVGGTNLSLHPKKYVALSAERQLGTHERSRSFAKSDGYIPAETIGAVLLKPLARAIEAGDPVLGVIRSTSMTHTGRSNGYGVPNPDTQAEVVEECLRRASIDPRTIGYIELAASGSVLGDPIELAALGKVFKSFLRPGETRPVGTVKSNIGHAEAASAITQLTKVLLQFEHRQLPASIRTEPPNPLIEWGRVPFQLVRERVSWTPAVIEAEGARREAPRRALLNSTGAGGTTVCMVLEEFVREPDAARTAGVRGSQLFPLSARTPERLVARIEQLRTHLQATPGIDLKDVAYTLQVGREAMQSRLAVVAGTREELLDGLQAAARHLSGGAELISAVPVLIGECIDPDGPLLEAAVEPGVLAERWVSGGQIDWKALHEGGARIVPLPVYPFSRRRLWLPPALADSRSQGNGAVTPSLPATDSGRADRMVSGGSPGPVTHDGAPGMGQPERVLDPGRRGFVAPRNDLERAIVRIWEEVLTTRGIGISDNFFTLGGNSLQAGLALSRTAEEFSVDLELDMLIRSEPTVAAFAVAMVSRLAALHEVQQDEIDAVAGVLPPDRRLNGGQEAFP